MILDYGDDKARYCVAIVCDSADDRKEYNYYFDSLDKAQAYYSRRCLTHPDSDVQLLDNDEGAVIDCNRPCDK